ncbi:hypothetical protein [Polynucleobacter sp. AM-7D1]|uniref:hypothetical protein n=1 Tax=Polynucleobacter sp. AM-7D1 TaxID=2689102 RepID=UPI001BFD541F|nr:hypothetical protein [Polynucleobacter sp. AM-7D1]QWE29009.1 hypothetical protein GQ359_01635 [Polynucleobacter sp. AM-7D1]
MKKHVFPLCFLFNSLSLSVLVITFAFSGNDIFAAEISVMQAAISGLLYAFSSNSRVTILSGSINTFNKLLMLRIYILVPVVCVSYFLVGTIGDFSFFLFYLILIRRSMEWIADLFLSEMERESSYYKGIIFLVIQSVLLGIVILLIYTGANYRYLMIIWCISPVIVFSWIKFKNSFINFYLPKSIFINYDITHFGSSIVIGLTLFIFRVSIVTTFGKESAGNLLSAFAIGGLLGAVFASSYAPSLALNELASGKKYFNKKLHLIVLPLFLLLGSSLVLFSNIGTFPIINNWKDNLFISALGYSCIASVVMYYAQINRNRLLIVSKDNSLFGADVLVSISTIFSINLMFLIFGNGGGAALSLVQSVLMYVFYKSSTLTINKKYIFSFYPILCLIVLPIFFKVEILSLTSTYIQNTKFNYFPISSILIIFLLAVIGNFQYARKSFVCIAIYFVAIYLSYFFGSYGVNGDGLKLLTITKYLLPPLALVLGEIVGNIRGPKNISSIDIFFYFIIVLIIFLNFIFDNLTLILSLQVYYILLSAFIILFIDHFLNLYKFKFIILFYGSIKKLYLYLVWAIFFCFYLTYVLYVNEVYDLNFIYLLFGSGVINTANYYANSNNLIQDIILNYGIAPSIPFVILIIFSVINSINSTSRYYILIILLFTIHLCVFENSGPYKLYVGIFLFYLWGYYISSFPQSSPISLTLNSNK